MIWFLFIGLIAGWLAGQLTKGTGFGLIGNLVVGVVGSYVGEIQRTARLFLCRTFDRMRIDHCCLHITMPQ